MNGRAVTLALVIAMAVASVVFIVGVFAGWWPYQWWEAFR